LFFNLLSLYIFFSILGTSFNPPNRGEQAIFFLNLLPFLVGAKFHYIPKVFSQSSFAAYRKLDILDLVEMLLALVACVEDSRSSLNLFV